MKQYFLLTTGLVLFLSLSLSAQVALKARLSVMPYSEYALSDFGFPDQFPFFNAEFGVRLPSKQSNWFWDIDLSYRYVRDEVEIIFVPVNSNDPFIPPDATFVYTTTYVGLKLGGVKQIIIGKGKTHFLIPFGIQSHFPLFYRHYSKSNKEDSEIQFFESDYYEYYILSGIYLQPTLQFTLGKKRSSPWKMGIYASGEMLFRLDTDTDPNFAYGGGIELSFQLQ